VGPVRSNKRRGFLGAMSAGVLALFGRRADAEREGSRPHRRVVTGLNAEGKSVVVSDGAVPEEGTSAFDGGDTAELWLLKRVPVDLSDAKDPIAGYQDQQWPPPGGVIARISTWQPGFSFPMHRSATIDFVFIIAGRLELLLEGASVEVGAGDCVVQRGTNHGWRVVGSEPCTLAGVLLAAVS
jgi:mannose-6-phosphate isomerase-like protein (cupin superfamily)